MHGERFIISTSLPCMAHAVGLDVGRGTWAFDLCQFSVRVYRYALALTPAEDKHADRL